MALGARQQVKILKTGQLSVPSLYISWNIAEFVVKPQQTNQPTKNFNMMYTPF